MKVTKSQVNKLFRKLNQHMLTLERKNGTNPDQAVLVINRLNNEINDFFGTKDVYKVRLSFDTGTGMMTMFPNSPETEELFDLYWKYNK